MEFRFRTIEKNIETYFCHKYFGEKAREFTIFLFRKVILNESTKL